MLLINTINLNLHHILDNADVTLGLCICVALKFTLGDLCTSPPPSHWLKRSLKSFSVNQIKINKGFKGQDLRLPGNRVPRCCLTDVCMLCSVNWNRPPTPIVLELNGIEVQGLGIVFYLNSLRPF